MTTQRNKVHAVSTLTLVARQLSVDEDWLADIAIGMEPECWAAIRMRRPGNQDETRRRRFPAVRA